MTAKGPHEASNEQKGPLPDGDERMQEQEAGQSRVTHGWACLCGHSHGGDRAFAHVSVGRFFSDAIYPNGVRGRGGGTPAGVPASLWFFLTKTRPMKGRG